MLRREVLNLRSSEITGKVYFSDFEVMLLEQSVDRLYFVDTNLGTPGAVSFFNLCFYHLFLFYLFILFI